MKLYELSESIAKIESMGFVVDEETGELLLDETQLPDLMEQKADKVLGIAKLLKNWGAEAEAIKAEEKRLSERRKTLERKQTHLQDYLLRNCQQGEAYADAQAQVKIKLGRGAVEILNLEAVPIEFLRVKTEAAPDKTAIANAIKGGQEFEWAVIAQKPSLEIK